MEYMLLQTLAVKFKAVSVEGRVVEMGVEHGGEAFDVAAAAATAFGEQQTPHFWLHFRALKDTGSSSDCRAWRTGRPGKTLRRSILIHIM